MVREGRALRSRARLATAAVTLTLLVVLATAPGAGAAVDPRETLTYIPNGLVHNERSATEVDGFLADLSSYGIGQVLMPMPKFKNDGTLKIPRKESRMIPLWAARTAAYNAGHGTDMTVTAVFNGRPKKSKLNLENGAVRASIVASVESVLAMGVGGAHLDLEPYPRSPGYILLLEELDAAFARRGVDGRLSVAAPTNLATWSPSYVAQVTSHLTQVDPLFYDSEFTTAAGYEKWVREGLAFYSANTAAGTRIIPVLPSYGPNPWHIPAVENIADATDALEAALQEGSRVNGAGVWWWYGFFYDEEGAYDASADRAAWQSSTLALPFTP